jgi:NhaP-type Na+/H+ or K+/H+ antiporter
MLDAAEPYPLILAAFGVVVLLTAWLPMLLKRAPISLPMVCIGIGALLAWSPFAPVVGTNPLENRYLTEKLTEFVVIVSLMGAGLKLDRPLSFAGWQTSWRLLGISMPLTIAGIAFLGWSILGLGIASALLLGAALAPTDPVLASDIQVGPPQSGEEDEVRFALTSEAGLNDGAAFPFVHLAIAIALSQASGEPFFADWFLVDVIWKIAAGIAIGWLGGKTMGYLTFRLPKRAGLSETRDGFVALGITCLAYGSTELLHGYGFLAVFVAAVAFRSVERKHHYHENLHNFAEQIERLLMMVLLVCFGAAIGEGTVFGALSW